MTGVLVGLLLGCGLFCLWWSTWPRSERPRRTSRLAKGLSDELAQAGHHNITPRVILVACGVCGTVVMLAALALTTVLSVSLCFGIMAAWLPLAVVRMRARARRAQLRDLWPDVVDNITSAVRAGMALPEALSQLAHRGPEELRPAFAEFASDYRTSGRFTDALDQLKVRLADPVGDRIVESLRIAREVGGSDLGTLLRTLSTFLREDARTRAELEARQSWTVNAARLAVAAPWIVLALLCTRPESVAAYDSRAGVMILAFGGAMSVLAYRLMMRLGRLPEEARVLR